MQLSLAAKAAASCFRLDANNGLNGSRWGFKGSEDIGGGLEATFTLKNGFELNTGNLAQGGDEFGRQTFVGLSNDRYGAVTLGRQYDPIIDHVGIYGFPAVMGLVLASSVHRRRVRTKLLLNDVLARRIPGHVL